MVNESDIDNFRINYYDGDYDEVSPTSTQANRNNIKIVKILLGLKKDNQEFSLENIITLRKELPGEAEETGLVGYWKMGESSWDGTAGEVIDSSGNSHHGRAYGGATTVAPGKYGSHCGSFDGTDDYIDCRDIVGFERNNAFSAEAWISVTSTARNLIVSKQTDAPNYRGWGFYILNGQVYVIIANVPFNSIQARTSGVFNDGNWHHVAFTYDGSSNANGIHIYIDGNEDSVVTYNALSDTILNSVNCQISGRDGANYVFEGYVDEVAIYNRALSAQEIGDHYKRGACNPKFQVRSGSSNPPTGEFVGPDGTKDTYFTDSDGEEIDVSDNRYFQYKAYFSTEDKGYTPELHSVTVTYSLPGTAGARTGPYIYHWEEVFE